MTWASSGHSGTRYCVDRHCRVDMRFVCPREEENSSETSQNNLLEEVGVQTRVRGIEPRSMAWSD